MKVYEKKQSLDVVDITCDICKKSCKVRSSEGEYFEYSMLLAAWGPKAKRKLEQHSCEMCEDCHEKVLNFIVYNLNGDIRISE